MGGLQYAKYSSDIRDVLARTDLEGMENLIRNVVVYIVSNNNSKVNWLAHELLADVIDNEDIIEIFDEE